MNAGLRHPHNRPIGEIAADHPGAFAVFRRFDIEFCCQGHVSLAEAARRRDLDPDEVMRALKAVDPSDAPKVPKETGALIDHIRTRYHDRHRRQLADLIALSQKVEAAHVNHPDLPAGLTLTLQEFRTELEKLMRQQEQTLFPALRDHADADPGHSIRFMRHDHSEFAFFLDRIDSLTDNCTLPDDACASWRALYADLAGFRADLIEHLHLENNVLFPRFETARPD